ncbi:translocation/assembly module TamB domain-containing protein [uncultured Bacteroides sp.]|uniref:translocation/assembly module TamB domain-containing protein n=1 Tax=uncultured Bacteroides sp. TaxID=162156 RepID=UPI002AABA0CF|nr:translocation/assembly module TamB domain-containing protein [uncultured Bacteroides sp.]
MAIIATDELEKILHTELSIGRVDIGLMNRIIIDDVLLKDQSKREMLKVSRLSAKFEILPLFKGKITIRSVQLFGFNIHLNKKTPKDPINCKFVIDAFASKDTVKKESKLDLRINSVLIRRGTFNYDILSEPGSPGKFNAKHIQLSNIIANISLKALRKDTINLSIKRLSLNEQSGFELKKLSLKFAGNAKGTKIENIHIGLPNTNIQLTPVKISYESPKAIKDFVNGVFFSTRILPSSITLSDLSPFIPALANFRDKLDLGMRINGTINQLAISDLRINANNNFLFSGGVAFQDLTHIKDTYLVGDIQQLKLSRAGMDFLVRNLVKNFSGTPDILKRLGNIAFKGEVSGYFNDLVTYGTFNTGLGTVKTDVKFSSNKAKGSYNYSGAIKTNEFNLGKLLNNEKTFGKTSLNLEVKGVHLKGLKPDISIKGLVSLLEYNGYDYKNIKLDGLYKNGGFDGQVALNDENGNVSLNGKINLSQKLPTFNFHADIRDIRPNNLHLTNKYKDAKFSLTVDANFTGHSIDDMIGEINVDSFTFVSPEKNYFMDNLNIAAKRTGGVKSLEINSKFLTATVKGNYSYQTIPVSIMKTVERYIPSLLTVNKKYKEPHNDFNFDVQIYNTDILSNVFNIPLNIYKHSSIKGYINDNERKLKIDGYFPGIQYNDLFFESGIILCETTDNLFKCNFRGNKRMKNSTVNLSLEAFAQNDKVHTSINWGNNAVQTYSGKFSTITSFFKTAGESPLLQAKIDVEPTEVILNDTVWNIHPSHIEVDSGRVYVDNFLFKHKGQFLRINGKATANANDTLKVELKDIGIGYIFDIVNLKSVDLNGKATGMAYASQIMKSPVMNANLFVKDFSFNKGVVGDMNVHGEWDKDEEGVYLEGKINESNISETNVKGYISPKKKGLDLHFDAHNTNIAFLQPYLQSIATDIKGRASGNVRLFGLFKALTLEGSALADASFKINVLNTKFAIKDSVRITPNEFTLNNVKLHDMEGHTGMVSGYVRHEHFKDMNYHLQMDAKNMLVYDTKESPDMPFYGKVYGTGNVLLTGNNTGLNIDAAISTNRNTSFVYMMANTTSAVSNQFVTFVDKTPKRRIEEDTTAVKDYFLQNIEKEAEASQMDIHLNMLVDATPEGTMKIIVDPISNDYMIGKGTGSIRLEYYNKGGVKMFGSYTVDHGTYKFSLKELIRKDFSINSGSSINFNGDPLNANLDIKAAYTVNAASLSDLGSEVPDDLKKSNVKVNCTMDITGNLLHPAIKLGIALPNESEEKQRIVQNVISTEDQINMQTLYLLGVGKFYTPNYATASQNSNAMTSVLSSTISGQLNNMLSQVINSSNWNIGLNGNTGTNGWTDMEFEGMLSGQLLNNRLLINGNFGYRENPTVTSNFVGNFDLEYLLTRSGTIRMKAYNQSNDRYYTRTTLNTQGLGIMYKKDFDTWNDLLPWNRKKKKQTVQPADSISNEPQTKTAPKPKTKRER